jgi:hypothetical protein
MFTNWLLVFGSKQRKQILVGATTLCWSIWKCRNDISFDNFPIKTYMQVLFRATHWCRQWVLLQSSDGSAMEIKDACRALETTVMQIFVNYGWSFIYIIE